MQFADNAFAQANLGLHCLLTEPTVTVIYVDEQKMLRSDCLDAMLIWAYIVHKLH